MSRNTPGPRELQLRAMREANMERAEKAAKAEPKGKPKAKLAKKKKKRPRRG